jgi:hypothetical protein
MRAPKTKQRAAMPAIGLQHYTKLENRLLLLAWLNSLLGYPSNRALLEDTKTVAEGFGADGRGFLYHHLIARGSQVKIPPALKPSEAQFVRDLKAYWDVAKDRALAGKEVFLLRNLSRGSGIGFFEERGFYPDFILWILDEAGQLIIFVEPHGMLHANANINNEKARLHERLAELALGIGRRSSQQDVGLDSYIISVTPLHDLRQRYKDGTWDREKFAQSHILSQERSHEYDYMKKVFRGQLTSTCS